MEKNASVTIVLTTAVDNETMNEIHISGLKFYGEASDTSILTVINAPDQKGTASTGEYDASTGEVTGLTVTPVSGYRFIGWVNNATGKIISNTAGTIGNLTESITVYPFCVPAEYPVLKVGNELYYYWQDAFAAADSTGITLMVRPIFFI